MILEQCIIEWKKDLRMITPDANQELEILLKSILNISSPQIITQSNMIVSLEEKEKIDTIINRRKNMEPLDHILGKKFFYKSEFIVNEHVLTPRSETEVLIERVLKYSQKEKNISRIIDIGTGSGCIAISISLENLHPIIASDISDKALEITKQNIKNHNKESQIQTRISDLLEDITPEEIEKSIIVTNLPYIPESDILSLEVTKYDPSLALYSEENGTAHYQKLFQELSKIKTFTALFFEFDPPQKEFFQTFLEELFPEYTLNFFADLNGDTRFGEVIL